MDSSIRYSSKAFNMENNQSISGSCAGTAGRILRSSWFLTGSEIYQDIE